MFTLQCLRSLIVRLQYFQYALSLSSPLARRVFIVHSFALSALFNPCLSFAERSMFVHIPCNLCTAIVSVWLNVFRSFHLLNKIPFVFLMFLALYTFQVKGFLYSLCFLYHFYSLFSRDSFFYFRGYWNNFFFMLALVPNDPLLDTCNSQN